MAMRWSCLHSITGCTETGVCLLERQQCRRRGWFAGDARTIDENDTHRLFGLKASRDLVEARAGLAPGVVGHEQIGRVRLAQNLDRSGR